MKNNRRRNTDLVTQRASLFAISGVRCYTVKVVIQSGSKARSVASTHFWNSVDPDETPQKHTLGNGRL